VACGLGPRPQHLTLAPDGLQPQANGLRQGVTVRHLGHVQLFREALSLMDQPMILRGVAHHRRLLGVHPSHGLSSSPVVSLA
jgi:hypothetical protein